MAPLGGRPLSLPPPPRPIIDVADAVALWFVASANHRCAGLSQSILAGALARAGQSVLHLDSNEYYGEAWGSLTLNELRERVSETPLWTLSSFPICSCQQFSPARSIHEDTNQSSSSGRT